MAKQVHQPVLSMDCQKFPSTLLESQQQQEHAEEVKALKKMLRQIQKDNSDFKLQVVEDVTSLQTQLDRLQHAMTTMLTTCFDGNFVWRIKISKLLQQKIDSQQFYTSR